MSLEDLFLRDMIARVEELGAVYYGIQGDYIFFDITEFFTAKNRIECDDMFSSLGLKLVTRVINK